MERVRFGTTDLMVTPIALGGWPFGVANAAHDWDPYSNQGRATAVATIHAALDRGINYIDTAPGYGAGNSETLIGEVMASRRDECVLATKVGWQGLRQRDVEDSVHDSLRRLRTDRVDIVQFHGGIYTAEDTEHILHGGPLTALAKLRDEGKIRHIGVTTEEPYSGLALIRSGHFDVLQLAYNFIYQAAALHTLDEARALDLGVIAMRSMTSGILQRIAALLVPGGEIPGGTYELCLKFLLSDSRVHVANVGMRWPAEVQRNADLVDTFTPPVDIADLPRSARGIYRAEDDDARSTG